MTLERIEPTAATDTWAPMLESVAALAEQIAATEFVPKGLRNNVPAVTAAILHGRELGLGPMTALSQTHVIDGKPTISAEGQRALAFAAGHEIEFVESTGAMCTVRGRRAGSERWTSVTWTIDAARSIGLVGRNPSWKNYPRAMLAARASAELCRLLFPDVLHGTAATEELDDGQQTDGAEVATKRATTPVRRQTRPTLAIPTPAPSDPATPPVAEWEPPPPPPTRDDTDPAPPAPVTPAQLKMLAVLWNRFDVTDDERRTFSGELAGRDLDGTTKNLTKAEAHGLINRLVAILRPLSNNAEDVLGDDIDAADARAALEREIESLEHNLESSDNA